jgi:hypothetical protein
MEEQEKSTQGTSSDPTPEEAHSIPTSTSSAIILRAQSQLRSRRWPQLRGCRVRAWPALELDSPSRTTPQCRPRSFAPPDQPIAPLLLFRTAGQASRAAPAPS